MRRTITINTPAGKRRVAPVQNYTVTLIVRGELEQQTHLEHNARRIFNHLHDIYRHNDVDVYLSLEVTNGKTSAEFERRNGEVVRTPYDRAPAKPAPVVSADPVSV